MKKEINLDEVLKENLKFDCIDNSAFENCKNAMMEFGKQLLELAAESAEMEKVEYCDEIPDGVDVHTTSDYYVFIDKQSIIDAYKHVII